MNDLVETFGYLGVALLMFLENIVPPIPSEVVMPFAGYMAHDGHMALWGVIIAGVFGSLAGVTPWYVLGRCVGRDRLKIWIGRWGKWLRLTEQDVDRADLWFQRHGITAVFVCRMIPGIRTLISLPAGFSRMHFGRFVLYSAPGIVIWTTLLATLGWTLRDNVHNMQAFIGTAGKVIMLGLSACLAVVLVRRGRREKVSRADSSPVKASCAATSLHGEADDQPVYN